MLSGTTRKSQYIPTVAVFINNLPKDSVKNLLLFHALAGCDTSSYFASHTKRSEWKIFTEHHTVLSNLGISTLTDTKSYILMQQNFFLLCENGKPEAMSPTIDALKFLMKSIHYQTMNFHHLWAWDGNVLTQDYSLYWCCWIQFLRVTTSWFHVLAGSKARLAVVNATNLGYNAQQFVNVKNKKMIRLPAW